MPESESPHPSEADETPGCPAKAATALGPIADSYDDLHRIDLLAAAIGARGVPPSSFPSAACAIFQASEVCLLNLARIARRTGEAIRLDDVALASRHVAWSVGFHRLLRRLGAAMFATRSTYGADARQRAGPRSGIGETAGYDTFVDCLKDLDEAVRSEVLDGDPDTVRTVLATRHLDDDLYRVLHGIRITCHDATKWESDLSGVPLGSGRPLKEVTSSALLAEAVAATELDPDTLHGEFVALHQVPEILCAEANDHLEAAIRALREDRLSRAVEHLSVCRTLFEPMVEAQRTMAELLTTGEYHEFRENLGPASGTHSLAIRQHMFKDLFRHLWTDLEAWIAGRGEGGLDDAVRRADEERHDDPASWLRHSVLDQAFRLHSAHQEWRHEHLHMPRNCLGSGGTKSMIGVPDGPQVVYKMRDAANSQHSLVALHEARRIGLANAVPDSSLSRLVADHGLLDGRIMRLVGEATRDHFPEVQKLNYQAFHFRAPERSP